MARQFGTHGGRPNLGGQAMERPHAAQNTRADSPDLEFGALIFALVAFTLPFAIAGSACIIWISFFE